MAAQAPPVLALVQIPLPTRAALEAAFCRVWGGRVSHVDLVEPGPDGPALAVIAAPTADEVVRIARRQEKWAPEVVLLAVVDDARALRSKRGGLPANVAWALSEDEIVDPRVLVVAMRLAVEVGARRRLERKLQATQPLADIGFVARATAHELGNPLTSLLTNLELARQQIGVVDAQTPPGAGADGPLAGAVNDALDGARHLARVAADLGVASNRSGRITVADVQAVVDTAVRLACEPLCAVRVVVSQARGCFGRVDETRLCQVLLNVLKNAARATSGRADATIEIEVGLEIDQVVVRVSDNGPGVPDAVARRLFEPYFTTRADGTGLGLPLCRQYLGEMGGTIELANTSDRGSVFEIRLPTADPRPVVRPTLVPDLDRGQVKILVLDDTLLVRRAIARVLSPPHDVHGAGTTDEAMALLAAHEFDLVFVDLQLDGESGIDFHRKLMSQHADRVGKVVMLSGVFDGAELAYIERHELACVRKPFGADELRQFVLELIGRS